ncbi:tRNA (adenosine(37)-N6)-threonylcarbamoyltransferase complex dimerization subunit type 1 TsaB [Sessilibacter corallicola]|uniref:tRNA threonylcarbamoyladenosine biosynthesis protein TsaB n=1 Tax=Sessilibacter corallicola TaxID=2904075 RepID=A0ABQ0A463_9GAMM
MKILALESSAETCSVALTDGHQDYIQIRHEPRQHAKMFLPLVQTVLDQAGFTLKDLDAIAFGRGPGSFTGLRICMSVVQGLAYGAEIPVIPISTLEGLAYSAQRNLLLPEGSTVVAGFDARMSEVYLGCFNVVNGTTVLQNAESVIGIEAAKEPASQLQLKTACFVGSAWKIEQLAEFSSPEMSDLSVTAEDILGLAKREFLNGNVMSVENAQPVYLRDDVAWEKRVRIRTENLV